MPKAKNRKTLPPVVEGKLINFFGGKICVVTGEQEIEDHNKIEWAHLDENRENNSFDNIIPLSAGYNHSERNLNLDQKRGRDWYDLTSDLKANLIFHNAHNHFTKGKPALAYGCSRLGLHYSMCYPRQFEISDGDQWMFLCQCLYYLPYKMNYELLVSTLNELNKLLEQNKCPSDSRAGILLSLANLYQDGGKWDEANSIYGVVENEGELPENILAATYRRRAIGSFFSKAIRQETDKLFNNAKELNKDDFNFNVSIDIAKAWKQLLENYPKNAVDILDKYSSLNLKNERRLIQKMNPHNIYELALTKADALYKIGEDYKPQIELISKLQVFTPNTKLRPVFTNNIAVVTFNPNINLSISPLAMSFIFTEDLSLLLSNITKKMLHIQIGPRNGRKPWVD